jgi:hypothetical protein
MSREKKSRRILDVNILSIIEHQNDFKWQKYELQSCTSRRKLQFKYNSFSASQVYMKEICFLKNILSREETFLSII